MSLLLPLRRICSGGDLTPEVLVVAGAMRRSLPEGRGRGARGFEGRMDGQPYFGRADVLVLTSAPVVAMGVG